MSVVAAAAAAAAAGGARRRQQEREREERLRAEKERAREEAGIFYLGAAPNGMYSPDRSWYDGIMGGTIACQRHWSRRDYDEDLMARARFSMEVLRRAPDDEDDPFLQGDTVVMDRSDCLDLLRRAKLALEFFYPHFRIHDEIMARVREDWDWRCKEFFSRLFRWDWKDRDGRALVEKHEKMIAGFGRMLDQVSSADKPRIEIETKVVRAARNWIAWHDSELGRCDFRGAYR